MKQMIFLSCWLFPLLVGAQSAHLYKTLQGRYTYGSKVPVYAMEDNGDTARLDSEDPIQRCKLW